MTTMKVADEEERAVGRTETFEISMSRVEAFEISMPDNRRKYPCEAGGERDFKGTRIAQPIL